MIKKATAERSRAILKHIRENPEGEVMVSVPLDAAQEIIDIFDTERQDPNLLLIKIALMMEMHADDDEVGPDYTIAEIHALIDPDDSPRWYLGLMMGIEKHKEEAA